MLVLTASVYVAPRHNIREGVALLLRVVRLLEREDSVDGHVEQLGLFLDLDGDALPVIGCAHYHGELVPVIMQQQGDYGPGDLGSWGKGPGERRVQVLVRHLVVGAFLSVEHKMTTLW